ncbi:MAG: hypothetical protein ACRCXB_23070, partial [Aeromonadaceae bacterium]
KARHRQDQGFKIERFTGSVSDGAISRVIVVDPLLRVPGILFIQGMIKLEGFRVGWYNPIHTVND